MRADAKAPCPICRMALEPSAAREAPGHIDPRALENLRRHDAFDVAQIHDLPSNVPELRAPAWVEDDGLVSAIFYNEQLESLGAGEKGTFAPTADPKSRMTVQRALDAPIPWDKSSTRLRFHLTRTLVPGVVGWVALARKPQKRLTVPTSAILHAPDASYVLVVGSDGSTFEKRPVELGETFRPSDTTVVLSGLYAEERVVARAAFFLDTELRSSERTAKQEAAR
ncbi:hypothetical protein LZC95_05690 [Pendulispora brunnea]|uniref:CzcB-like C-terminal circularly permuted SH3-like domain-containing protein n=1 Tax=Pendulispora brunnea TaxID=2905690 RepID=A0ABZ2KCB6_9BACT